MQVLLACEQDGGDIAMVKSSSMDLETSRLTHHRNVSLPGGTLDNATLGSDIYTLYIIIQSILHGSEYSILSMF